MVVYVEFGVVLGRVVVMELGASDLGFVPGESALWPRFAVSSPRVLVRHYFCQHRLQGLEKDCFLTFQRPISNPDLLHPPLDLQVLRGPS